MGVNALGVEDPADVDLTITDDETPALALTLSLSPRVVMEDAGATEVKVTAVLEGVPGETAMTLAMSVGGGTAEPEDYVPVDPFELTIRAGQVSGNATFMLMPLANDGDEPDETLRVNAVMTHGLTVLPAGGVVLTLSDGNGNTPPQAVDD